MKISSFIFITFVLLTSPIFPGIINVPVDQPTIQQGINAAANGDTVLVADSTYYENINFLGKAITVASHFLVDNDTSHISATIIDGSQPTNPNSGSVVSFVSGEDTNSVLCGFTITNGTGSIFNYGYQVRSGGGVLCLNSGASIENNKIINNSVSHNSASGGGISVISTTSINVHTNVKANIIINNNISGISEAEGGGLFFWYASGKLIGNVINNNSNVCSNNKAWGGGVFFRSQNASVIFKDNQVSNNLARGIDTSPTGAYGALGGGLFVLSTETQISDNIITHNKISGIYNAAGAGIYIALVSGITKIYNNIISYNKALQGTGWGSGLYIASRASIINSTITFNDATVGGGIYSENSISDVMNSIIWGNQALNGSGIYLASDSINVVHSDIQDTLWPGQGNINHDPLFAPDSIHLSPASPCIGAGIDTLQMPPFDFEDDPRPWPAGCMPDMGADESPLCEPIVMLKNVNLGSKFINENTDTLRITSDILKPDSINLQVYASIQNINNTFADSVLMYNDGNHDDGQANDTIWGGYFGPVSTEDMYELNIIVKDFSTINDSLISFPEFFTSIGPIKIDGCTLVQIRQNKIQFNLALRNDGDSTAAENVQAKITIDDSCVSGISNNFQNFGTIGAGQSVAGSTDFIVTTINLPDSHSVVFHVEIFSNGSSSWLDSIYFFIVGISEENEEILKVYTLEQNYPNPFNPITNIQFSIPKTEFVTLKIYNLLGQEIADLVSKKLVPGNYKYTWDASACASGVYLYKLEAGNYVQTKKLILLK